MIVIYYNFDCGILRNVLQLIEVVGYLFQVIEYVKEGWIKF